MATSKAPCQEKVPTSYDALETNHVVAFSEIEDRVWCLQLDKEEKKHVAPSSISDQETKDGGWSSVKETIKDETLVKEEKKEVVHDETIGKGLALDKLPPKENIQGSWKIKVEKRRKQSPEELKNFDLAISVKRMRESLAKMDRQGQSTVEKDFAGGLTPSERAKEVLKTKQKTKQEKPSFRVERMREAQAKYE